jgi:hypothetical protein
MSGTIEYIGLPKNYTGYFVKKDGSVWWMSKGKFIREVIPSNLHLRK